MIYFPLVFSSGNAVNRAGSTPPALPACPWIAIFALPGIPCRPSHAGSRFSSPPASQNDGQPVVLQRELILFVALVALDGGNPLGIGNDDSKEAASRTDQTETQYLPGLSIQTTLQLFSMSHCFKSSRPL